MPKIAPIPAIVFNPPEDRDLSTKVAPPYDVLDQDSKNALVQRDPHNIVVVDLPHLPPKTVGPDETYEQAGRTFRQWIEQGVLKQLDQPAVFVYQQTYTLEDGRTFERRGVWSNVAIQPFGPGPGGSGGIFPHEQTFGAPKEDRLKLMHATRAQLSPIFGLFSDPEDNFGPLLNKHIQSRPADCFATTDDGVKHEVWLVTAAEEIEQFSATLGDRDIFIADGHHRYTTALNYRQQLEEEGKELGNGDWCLFVLVSMQDPGMIVLPTHRVLGEMTDFSLERFIEAAEGKLKVVPHDGGLASVEAELPKHGPHAMGLYCPASAEQPVSIITTVEDDPLASSNSDKSDAWRSLDVAIVQELIVKGICEPTFCGGGEVKWKFPHDVEEVEQLVGGGDYQMGLIMQSTPLEAVRAVSEAGELMPPKSTFFYPKLATGLAVNPL